MLRVRDTALFEPHGRLQKAGTRHVERDVLHTPHLPRGQPTGIGARFIRKHRKQSPVTGIEIQMVLLGATEVRLFEDERHAEDTLPEIDGRLSRGADKRDVVDSLHLNALHVELSRVRCIMRKPALSTKLQARLQRRQPCRGARSARPLSKRFVTERSYKLAPIPGASYRIVRELGGGRISHVVLAVEVVLNALRGRRSAFPP